MIDKFIKQGILQSFSSVDSLHWKHSRGIVISNEALATNTSQYEWVRQISFNSEIYSEVINKGEVSDYSRQVLLSARSLVDGTFESKSVIDFYPLLELRNKQSEHKILLTAFPIILFRDSNISTELNRLLDNISDLDTVISTRLYIMGMYRILTIKKNLDYGFLLDFLLSEKVISSIFSLSPQNNNDSLSLEKAKTAFIDLVNRIRTNLQSGPIDIYSSTLNLINRSSDLGKSTREILAVFYTFSKYISNPLSGIEKFGSTGNLDVSFLCPLLGALYGALDSGAWIPINWQSTEDSDYINTLSESILKNPTVKKQSFIEKIIFTIKCLNPRYKYLLTKSKFEKSFGTLSLIEKTELKSHNSKKMIRRKYKDINKNIYYIYN